MRRVWRWFSRRMLHRRRIARRFAAPTYLLKTLRMVRAREEWFAPEQSQHAMQDPQAQRITMTDDLKVHFANESDAPESGPRRNAYVAPQPDVAFAAGATPERYSRPHRLELHSRKHPPQNGACLSDAHESKRP